MHSGIHEKSLLHHFRLHALFIHTNKMIPSPFLGLLMNLQVQSNVACSDGSFDDLDSNIGQEFEN